MGLLQGVGKYDSDLYSKLVKCMSSQDIQLQASQEAAWSGFLQYFEQNGTADDRWGSCTNVSICNHYMENNATALPGDVPATIYEPCNYVSNVAYYRVVPQLCDHTGWTMEQADVRALIQGFSALAFGSSFWHGSHTWLGNQADNRFIDVISFVSYQAAVASLPCNSTDASCDIIKGLNATKSRRSSVISTQKLSDMLRTTNVNTWLKQMTYVLDMPQYFLTFSAIICNLLNLLLPPELVDELVSALAKAFNLPPQDYDFITTTYLPTLRRATEYIKLNKAQELSLALAGTGTVTKLMYAFLWQENVFPWPLFKKPEVNKIGAALMPWVNKFANFLTGFVHTDSDFQNAKNVYPGDSKCRVEQPHSKWHEESANGLLDLVFLCDYIAMLTKQPGTGQKDGFAGWWQAVTTLSQQDL
eukprot:CAMPEP_0175127334 /NCGR_PEP_ID=MMETSP0087-20121206/4333_1 /TAXON_ID=136419 /ORGANISM="Unknown Unknown, Strain D1" /LENGTH=415 /DNA_ID=CAMNT_0016409309 /DNA_START=128 /DNA_END=1375 /DNA_ORIENTATION=-